MIYVDTKQPAQKLRAAAPTRRPGRPPRLGAEQQQLFRQRLEAGPRPEDRTRRFSGRDLQQILNNEFNVYIRLSSVYALLHRIGYAGFRTYRRQNKANELKGL